MKKPKSKSRSGTQWSESDYAAAGYSTIKLRLPVEVRAQLAVLAQQWDASPTAVVCGLVMGEVTRSQSRKTPKP